ncbi:MAG: META domain-containing protein [Xanthomonadales bacterium]|nr:META domain-containing protein [Xanthomonadales bacterium]
MHTLIARGCGVLAVLILVSCSKPANEAAVSQADSAPGAETTLPASVEPAQVFDAAAARYTGFEEIAELVQLEQGKWEGAPWIEGAAARLQIILLDGVETIGDLNGDGSMESAVLLNLAMGGSGQLLYLAAIPSDADSNSVISVTLVGDRVQVRDVKISNGRLLLDVLQAGPGDAMCCPGELATRAWEMSGVGELLEVASGAESQRFAVARLASSEWVLDRWSRDELAENTAVSLSFSENGIAGSSGCNRYNASISDGESPGEVSVGPVAGTRMACPEEPMAVEARYLQALSAVNKLSFIKGQLLLTSVGKAGISSMYFDLKAED